MHDMLRLLPRINDTIHKHDFKVTPLRLPSVAGFKTIMEFVGADFYRRTMPAYFAPDFRHTERDSHLLTFMDTWQHRVRQQAIHESNERWLRTNPDYASQTSAAERTSNK